MKLPTISKNTQLDLAEFDVWITPTLGEIRETPRFTEEMDRVVKVFEMLSAASSNFANVTACSPQAIADAAVAEISSLSMDDATEKLRGLASVLFLVSGKSDNNAKCQFPLYLRAHPDATALPAVRRASGKTNQLQISTIPRTLDSERLIAWVASLAKQEDHQKRVLKTYIEFILNSEPYISQLWCIGKSYVMLKTLGKERDLLSPLVVFQVRGSVSASGGHDPEELLRRQMSDWGLLPGVDFNLADVHIASLVGAPANGDEADEKAKKRSYDFILPFKSPTWSPRIFIQCQFYAGDSGSVSHKNVDQTKTSRATVQGSLKDPLFVEYVDGAGYFSSLNGDLKKLLQMPSTAGFVQIKSAPIRLRRALQTIGFLVPLEVEHAIVQTDGVRSHVHEVLVKDGYASSEIDRIVEGMIAANEIASDAGSRLTLKHSRHDIVRRYFLLDTVARFGKVLEVPKDSLKGMFLIPGYGPFFGLDLTTLGAKVNELAPGLKQDWSSPECILGDIEWLCRVGYAMSG